MIFKQEGSIIVVARRYKIFLIFKTCFRDKAMLVQGKSLFIYLLSSNSQIWLWHRYLSHTSNTKVIQALKLVDKIDLGKAKGRDNQSHSSDFKLDDENKKFDDNNDSKPITINKKIEYNFYGMKQFCKACIESKHIKIIKSKKIMQKIKKLQKVYANLWGFHKPASITGKNYLALLLNEFSCKS